MALIRFTANYADLSTDRGYQFRFHCDKCGNGFMSRFQTSVTGVAGDPLRAAGNIFGGILSSAGNSAYDIQRAFDCRRFLRELRNGFQLQILPGMRPADERQSALQIMRNGAGREAEVLQRMRSEDRISRLKWN